MNKKVIVFFSFIIVFHGKVTWASSVFDESVYRIKNETKNGIMTGTGFAVKYKNENFILTTLHLLSKDKNKIKMFSDDKWIANLSIYKTNLKLDLVLLKIKEVSKIFFKGIKALEIFKGDVSSLAKEKIVVVGFPLSLGKKNSINGNISDINCFQYLPNVSNVDIPESNILKHDVLMLEASLTHGHSGSPILVNNKVVGVLEGGLDSGRTNITWAIPFTTDTKFHNEDISKESFAFARNFSMFKPTIIISFNELKIQWENQKTTQRLSFEEAEEYRDTRNREKMLGYSDWRLPNRDELLELRKTVQRNGNKYKHLKYQYRTNEQEPGYDYYISTVVNLGNEHNLEAGGKREKNENILHRKSRIKIPVILVRTLK